MVARYPCVGDGQIYDIRARTSCVKVLVILCMDHFMLYTYKCTSHIMYELDRAAHAKTTIRLLLGVIQRIYIIAAVYVHMKKKNGYSDIF